VFGRGLQQRGDVELIMADHIDHDRDRCPPTMNFMNEDLAVADVPFTHDPWVAARTRYDEMPYRRVGTSGLVLPAISLGLW
jgi:hypothetical protein